MLLLLYDHEESHTERVLHGQVIERHLVQTGGAQLGPPAAAVAQPHDHLQGQVIERHNRQTGRAQLDPTAVEVGHPHDQLQGQVIEWHNIAGKMTSWFHYAQLYLDICSLQTHFLSKDGSHLTEFVPFL